MYWFRILKKEKKKNYLVQIFFRGQESESKLQGNSYKLGSLLNYASTIGVIVTSFIEICFRCDLS